MKMKKGTLNTEAAVVNGAKVKVKNEEELQELVDLERSQEEAAYRLIDAKLTGEIVDNLRGHFAVDLVYNIPRKSNTGKMSWKECDRMKGGCSYKNQSKHVHTLGVGYKGMLVAVQAYGRMKLDVPEPPSVVEEDDRYYWAAYGTARDGHTGNQIGRWYLQPLMMKAGNSQRENEHAAHIAESKALRNAGLALLPPALLKAWLDDYRNGKEPFSPERAKEMGYDEETEKEKPEEKRKPKEKSKSTTKTGGQRDLAEATKELATKMKVDAKELEDFSAGYFDSIASAGKTFNRALDDKEGQTVYKSITEMFTEWKSKQGEDGEQTEIPM